MKNLWAWIVRPLLGNVDIKSCDDKIYANMDAKVMVSLDRTSDDPLTFWVQNQVIPVYHRFIGRRLLVLSHPYPSSPLTEESAKC